MGCLHFAVAVFRPVRFPVAVGGDVAGAGAGHGGVRVADPAEVGEPRAHIEVFEQGIVLGQGAEFTNLIPLVFEVTEDDGVGGAGLLAGGLEGTRGDADVGGVARPDLGGDFSLLEPLDAEGAFFHDATHPDGDVRVFLELDGLLGALRGDGAPVELVEGALVVIEEIKTTDLVRAVVSAVPRADARSEEHTSELQSQR